MIEIMSLTNLEKNKRFSNTLINTFDLLIKPLPTGPFKFRLRNTFCKLVKYIEFKLKLLFDLSPKQIKFENIEQIKKFNFSLPLFSKEDGVSAFIRVKNEDKQISACLLSILDVFDEIVIVDNDSSDSTLKVIRKLKAEHDHDNKIKIFDYPFKLALFGSDYSNTPENSVHNFAFYSNYAISKCSRKMVCKWDADMILKADRKSDFKSFLAKIGRSKSNSVWNIYGQTVYQDVEGNLWLSHQEVYYEPRIFSLSYYNIYAKGRYFEILDAPSLNLDLYIDLTSIENKHNRPLIMRKSFPDVLFYEFKSVDRNEFSHWTTEDVAHTPRKRKEIKAFQLIRSAEIANNNDFSILPEADLA